MLNILYLLFQHRSLKSDYSEHRLDFKGYRDLDTQEKYPVSRRGFSPHCAPVIVEHDHGIPKHDARIRNPSKDQVRPRSHDQAQEREWQRSGDPGRDREQPKNCGSIRNREHPRNRDLVSQRDPPKSHDSGRNREHPRDRDPLSQRDPSRSHDPGRNSEHPKRGSSVRHQEHPRSHDLVRDREHPRTRDLPSNRGYPKDGDTQRCIDPTKGRESSRGKEHHKQRRDYSHNSGTSHSDPSGSSICHIKEDSRFRTASVERGRMGSHSREAHGPGGEGNFRINENNRARASLLEWQDELQPRANHGCLAGQRNVLKRNPPHRNPNHPETRTDFASHETLKIKVDMSRPVHQSRYSIAAAVF